MKIFPIFIPQQGCQQQCVYCNQFLTTEPGLPDLELTENKIKNFVAKNKSVIKQIAFFGGTFTLLEKSQRRQYYSLTKKYLDDLCSVRISTRPDAISDNILNELIANGVKTIELGVQSFAESVLKRAGRNYRLSEILSSINMIKTYGFEIGIQIMPGLPGETDETLKLTVEQIILQRPDFVRIYPTLVLKGTELEKWYYTGKYVPWDLEKAVEECSKITEKLSKKNIMISKLGLHSDIGDKKENMVAGPYHPAFAELVYGEMMLNMISERFVENCNIKISNLDRSLFEGHNKRVLSKLKKKHGESSFKISYEADLKHHQIRIENVNPRKKKVIT